ncbi:hypothetical protein [Paraburkholderia hospita]|uniref:hypothetical protein n=1 Tax=Paraburkholderia hospita TaxID=169430 RepID=UPI000B34417E|nr:hypothetical protein [Paraburkholderia hospita]OUL86135.1 hypothetical protein CA603_22890 [Paraburkholderia hospita]
MQNRGEHTNMAGELISEISSAKRTAWWNAKKFEFGVILCWWGAVALGALASALGVLAEAAPVKALLHVEPWMIGLMTAGATGLEVLRRKTSWRAKSNAYYGFDQKCMQLLMRIRFEMPKDLKAEHIAAISREFREADGTRGMRLKQINDGEDEPASSTTKKA